MHCVAMPAISRPHDTAQRFALSFGDGPVPVRHALAAGFTEAQLRAAVQRGLLSRVRHGVIRIAAPATPDDAEAAWIAMRNEHVAAVRAALSVVGPGAFATYDSAALVVGCTRSTTSAPKHVTLAMPGARDYTGPGLVVRGSPIPDHHVTVVDGIPATNLPRTAVDLARGRPLWSALVPLDAASRHLVALRSGTEGNDLRRAARDPVLVAESRADLHQIIESISGWQGVVAARRALAYANASAESPTESRSRAWFLAAGLPPLDIGAPVQAGSRTYWADFCDEGRRVIGEADGWMKYGHDLESMRSTLSAERSRQAELERVGWRFVRWMSDEPRGTVVARMSAALR